LPAADDKRQDRRSSHVPSMVMEVDL